MLSRTPGRAEAAGAGGPAHRMAARCDLARGGIRRRRQLLGRPGAAVMACASTAIDDAAWYPRDLSGAQLPRRAVGAAAESARSSCTAQGCGGGGLRLQVHSD